MMPNLGFEVAAHYDNDDVNFIQLKYDCIRMLKQVLLPIFHKYIHERRREEWEYIMDDGW